MEYNDEQILNQLRAGNDEVFECIFLKFYKILSMQAFYLLKDEMDAEDLVQTLFLDFWDKKLYLNVNSSLKAYLHKCVRNRCLNFLQYKKIKEKNQKGYGYTEDVNYEYQYIDTPKDNRRIDIIITQIPRKRMRAFNLVYLENKKYQDAANEMGISINSVKTHLKLAIKDLRERIYNFE